MNLRTLAALLFLLLAAAPASAIVTINRAEQIGGASWSPAVFVRVELTNRGDRPLPATLSVSHSPTYASNTDSTIEREIPALAPGESRVVFLELLNPVQHTGTVTARWPGGQAHSTVAGTMSSGYHYGHSSANFQPVLRISDARGLASGSALTDFTSRTLIRDPNTGRRFANPGTAHLYRPGITPTVAAIPQPMVIQLTNDVLPETWGGFTAFQAILIPDHVYRRLPAGTADAILTWVRYGGQLWITESDRDEIEDTPATREMAGNVFRTKGELLEANTGNYPAFLAPESPIERRGLATGTLSMRGLSFDARAETNSTIALLVATAFLIVAGPLNYFYHVRRNRIRRLLVTVPLFSIGACLLIAADFVVTKGFQRIGGTLAFTFLDEGRDQAFTLAGHSIYSGLYPPGGIKWPSNTLFVPGLHPNEYGKHRIRVRAGETNLVSGLFRPGRTFHYATLQPLTTRERLLINFEKMTVINGFEFTAQRIMVCDDGRYFVTREATRPGAESPLQPFTQPTAPHADSVRNIIRQLAHASRGAAPGGLESAEAGSIETLITSKFAEGWSRGETQLYALWSRDETDAAPAGLVRTQPNFLHVLAGIPESAAPLTASSPPPAGAAESVESAEAMDTTTTLAESAP